MKVRGKLTVTENMQLPSLEGTMPDRGKYAVSLDTDGNVTWRNLVIPEVDITAQYGHGDMVIYTDGHGKKHVYVAVEKKPGDPSNGDIIGFPNEWILVGGISLAQNIIDALNVAHSPSGTNEFVTKTDMIATEIYFQPGLDPGDIPEDDVQGALEWLLRKIEAIAPPSNKCECISTIDIGPFPPGTPLEDIIKFFHIVNDIYDFRMAGHAETTILFDMSTVLIQPTFEWKLKGTVTDIEMRDTQDNTTLPIPDNQVTLITLGTFPSNLPVTPYHTVTWTLSALVDGNRKSQTVTAMWGAKAYYGFTTGLGQDNMHALGTMTENFILTEGISVLADIRQEIVCPINDLNATVARYYWFAIPRLAGVQQYAWWRVNDVVYGNFSRIDTAGPGSNFIFADPNDVMQIGGVDYDIYYSAYPSAVHPYIVLSIDQPK